MFDFENLFSTDNSVKVTVTRQQKQSVADRRRDVYESHRHRTFALAYYMTGNEIEAETILTDTFVQAFSAKQEPAAQDVDAALVRELKTRFALGSAHAPVTQEYARAGEADLSKRNIRRTELEEVIPLLPAQERLLFLLRDVEGYSSAAIAQLLEISETEVNRSLLSARIRLRRALAAGVDRGTEAA